MTKKKKPSKPALAAACALLGKKCEDGICCQAVTANGKACKRKATYELDLTKGVKVLGIEVCPKIGCCFFCTQHLKMTAVTGIAKLTEKALKVYATKSLDYDQYYSLFPEEDPLRG